MSQQDPQRQAVADTSPTSGATNVSGQSFAEVIGSALNVEFDVMTGTGSVLPPAARREAAAMAVLRAAREHGYTVSRTKLAKLLYLADLRAVEAGGDPVSGVTWKWLDYGPFNTVMYDVERALTLSGRASSEKVLGVEEELAREFEELRPARARVNRLIGDP